MSREKLIEKSQLELSRSAVPQGRANVKKDEQVEESVKGDSLDDRALRAFSSGKTNPSSVDTSDLSKPFAPLKIPLFRSFWIAGLVSNLGTWMHETGAQWLMVSLDPSPEMVSAVRTSMTVPIFFLALPAGVWADRFDRRNWLLGTQTTMLVVASLMAILTALEWMSPAMLLVLTASMGIGMILNQPAWQSLTPELVPAALVPSAVSVGSISFNLARSLGPLLAGMLIALVGIWCPFVFNAVSFLAVVLVLVLWKEELQNKPTRGAEVTQAKREGKGFWDELKNGLLVVRASEEVRNVLIRVFFFALPASILWSLLSLIATDKMHFKETGFGLCLGVIGAGAVAGAMILPYLRTKCSSESILLASQFGMSAICVILGVFSTPWILLPVLAIVGACWMGTMTTLNATAQVYLPKEFRARGMSAFMMSFALAVAIGSAIWGWLAYWTSIDVAYITAGGSMFVFASMVHRLHLGSLKMADRAA